MTEKTQSVVTRRDALRIVAVGSSGVAFSGGVAGTATARGQDDFDPTCIPKLRKLANLVLTGLDLREDGKEKQAQRKFEQAAEVQAELNELVDEGKCALIFIICIGTEDLVIDQPCISDLRAGLNQLLTGLNLLEEGREERAKTKFEQAQAHFDRRDCGIDVLICSNEPGSRFPPCPTGEPC